MDPITLMAGATAAFNGVQRLVAGGRQVEDVITQVGKWYGAIADAKEQQKKMENPPLFKKLMYASSVEQEALNAIILKKKIEEQEKDIRELIMFRFGKETLMEMFELRKQIARDREKAKLKQQRFRRGVTDGIFILGGLLAGIGVILWAVNLITSHGPN